MNPLADTNPAACLADVASRLKQAKDAYRGFLTLWAAERLADDARGMESLISDLDYQLEEDQRSALFKARPLDD